MTRFTQEHLDAFSDLIRRAFPDGLDEETGRLVYSALAGGEVVMTDGRRLHRSWRGTGSGIAEAGAPGDYMNYYLAFLPHDDPTVAVVRERILALEDVVRIEMSPRLNDEADDLFFPNEEEDPTHETGWNLTVVFEPLTMKASPSLRDNDNAAAPALIPLPLGPRREQSVVIAELGSSSLEPKLG